MRKILTRTRSSFCFAYRERSSVALVVAACMVGGLCAPTVALAQPATPTPSEDAASNFERGVKFFKEADYVAAMVQFKKAYELDPNYAVLYNIGQTARELKSYSEALNALERYLSEGGANVSAERRVKVEVWVSELREKVATVTLTTNIEGVDIAVDDVEVGRTPLAKPVIMNAGKRKITASKEGYQLLTRWVEVAGAEQKKIELELVSLTGKSTIITRPATENEVKHTPWPWVGLGLTAAAGIATGVLGGIALSKKDDFEAALDTYPTTPEAVENARSSAKTFAVAADAMGGVTGGFAALTLIAFIVDYTRKPTPAEPPPDTTKEVGLVPLVGPGFAGLAGSF